jgi:transglutaminase-like putative cysteine protease
VALLLLIATGTAAVAASPATQPTTRPQPAARREFLFTYEATITGLQPGQVARIWLPVAPSNADQQAVIDRWTVPPDHSIGRERKYHNHVLYARAAADNTGSIPLSVTYRVARNEVAGDITRPAPPPAPPPPGNPQAARPNAPDPDADPFLQPDALIPVTGKPLELLRGRTLPDDRVARARALYDLVLDRMEYRKDKPGWGRGDALWASRSRCGNCSDFHSLFICLARTNHIPATFEIGFPLPPGHGAGDVPGYHCWAKFKARPGEWVPVDISEAKRHPDLREYYFGRLTPDRVVFSTGRDLVLEPRQDGPPVNFFIYAYVEVDGKPWPAERVTRHFAFSDVEPKPQ